MSSKLRTRLLVDAAMAIDMVLVMACALVQEVPHEYLGVAMFALVVAHLVLNRHWFKVVRRGRYTPARVLQAVSIVALVLCCVAMMASSLVLSRYAFGFLPALPGASWARGVHMLCSYWIFVLCFAHAGLQIKPMLKRMVKRPVAARVSFGVVACYGIYSFVRLGIGPYLLGMVSFAFADLATPLPVAVVRWASVGVLVAGSFHYVRCALEATAKKRATK